LIFIILPYTSSKLLFNKSISNAISDLKIFDHLHLNRVWLQVLGAVQLQLLAVSLVVPPNDAQLTQVLVVGDQIFCPLQEQVVLVALPAPFAIAVQLMHSPDTTMFAAGH
jgi:hypothetical protein